MSSHGWTQIHTNSNVQLFRGHFAIALLAIALPLSALGQEAKARQRTLSVNEESPMYDAIRQLRARYGWLISYQDPPYEHPDDLVLSEGPRTKMLIPRRMRISVDYEEPEAADLKSQQRTIDQIVAGFGASGAGTFRVYHWGIYSYVVPLSVKRVNGVVENLPPLCEMTVSFPPAIRTIEGSLALILPRISQHIQAPIKRGVQPNNLFLGHSHPSEAQDEPICALMSRTFEGANWTLVSAGFKPVYLAWELMFEPTSKQYYFSVEKVDQPKGPIPAIRVEPQKTDK
jgi:hypothetical protein